MTRSLLLTVLYWAHQVALAVWLGGIATVGAISAPAVFGTAKRLGHTEWGQPLYDFAGTALGVAFERLNYVSLGAGVLVLITGVAYGLLGGYARWPVWLRAALTLSAAGVAAWLTFSLYPHLVQVRTARDIELFGRLHQAYTNASLYEAVMLLGVTAVSAYLHVWGRSARCPAGTDERGAGQPAPSNLDEPVARLEQNR